MKRRPAPEVVTGGLPADIAAGPVPELWPGNPSDAHSAWVIAGQAWSRANGLGGWGWLPLLPGVVKWTYMPSALERAAQRAGCPLGYIEGKRTRPS